MTSPNNSSSTSRTPSYKQQKSKSKQIDNLLYGNSSSQINNQQQQIKSSRPLRILLMGPRNCGIKTFLMNALDMEADDFMIHSMLTVSQRVNQLSNDNIAENYDTDSAPLSFQEKIERKLFSNNTTTDIYMYICRGIKVFVKWERKYFERKFHESHHNEHHTDKEHFTLIYDWEGDEDCKLLDELINDCRDKNRLNAKISLIYSKIVNYGKKEVMNEFYNSLLKLTNVRYLDNIQ